MYNKQKPQDLTKDEFELSVEVDRFWSLRLGFLLICLFFTLVWVELKIDLCLLIKSLKRNFFNELLKLEISLLQGFKMLSLNHEKLMAW